MSVTNHYFFRTFAFDYGPYNYAFWDYAHFRITPCPMYSVFWGTNVTFLQDHFSFLLMFLAPFYWLFYWLTGSYTLMLIQVAFILWGAWAVYKIINLKTNDVWLGLIAVVYYFLLHGRYSSFDEDCNLIIMGSCFVPVFIWYFESKQYVAAIVVFIIASLSREDMPLWFIFIGIVLLLWHRKEKKEMYMCLGYILASLVCFIITFKVFIPLTESPDKRYNLFMYKALGTDPFEAFIFIIKHPLDTFMLLFKNHLGNPQYDGIKTEFYLVYLLSGAFILFLRPQYFIWFIPLVAQKMFNDEPVRWSIESYYTVQIATLLPVPVFLILANEKTKKWRYLLAVMLCSMALFVTCYELDMDNHKFGFGKGTKKNIFDANFFNSPYNIKAIHHALELIPEDARVCASSSVLPHLAKRKHIYEFPDLRDAEYVAVFSLPDFYAMPDELYTKELYDKYIFNPYWKLIANEYPFILLKKENDSSKIVNHNKAICNAETSSPDHKYLISSDNQLLDNDANTIETERVYTGKYSIKLTKEKPFGMTWHLKNFEANDLLRISVWRYTESKNNGDLVVSNGKDFYLSAKDGINKDSAGWEQIIIYCTVPTNHQDFVTYVWNNGDKPVWFDDMEIQKTLTSISIKQ